MNKETPADNVISLSNEAIAALILKIRDGDASALADLYDKTGCLLFGLILKVVDNRALAEEALLDVYTQIWNQAASCDRAGSPLEWMLSIARTRAVSGLNWHKKDGKKREFSPSDPDSKMTVAPEAQKLARTAMESLVPMQREILDYIYYSGLSCSEIALQTGKPLGAIKTHACLGLCKLSEMVRPLFENETETAGGTIEARSRD